MSRCLHTNPDRIYDDMRSLRPDATLTLEGGRYATPLVLSSVSGSQQQPVVIHGNGAVIDGGGTYEDYRETANRLSAVQEANGRFPGIYYLADNAALVLRNCQWIVIEDLNFEGCWPTAIYLDNCQHITLRRLHIRGSTIAIGAAGPYTRHLLIEACDWIQDLQSHGEADLAAIRKTGAVNAGLDPGDCRLWREISWSQVHGNIEDTNSRVNVETDERGFDGDFFRAWTIAGYVVLRNNVILDAFNGIHFFNDASDSTVEDFCRNIVIENNWFVRIRDNAIEAEDYAWNWTVHGNKFINCYMPFSLEMHRSGYFYIYGNLGWNQHRPGPDGDDRNFGQLFKFPKQHEAVGPHYVFNNSWMLRGPISKRNRISQFHHLNNAISYYGTAGCRRRRIPRLLVRVGRTCRSRARAKIHSKADISPSFGKNSTYASMVILSITNISPTCCVMRDILSAWTQSRRGPFPFDRLRQAGRIEADRAGCGNAFPDAASRRTRTVSRRCGLYRRRLAGRTSLYDRKADVLRILALSEALRKG
ncbi:right-handed parallel beta-helix repeat-containing protein [Rhizobium leguminosarum]|uniref:right-handed parallel beta-helix repeat-containing protein n=1 Tax=Rhizobium leguminosarum TaxID=384 RepID=UPI001FE11B90|nr:right-handed parallel beta-helix repeat-containing protein [Rhizobium leguminosarum]